MGESRTFRLSEAGIKASNNYFYLTGQLDFFPHDSHGGSNEREAGRELCFSIIGLPEVIWSDIDRTKPFIRKRFWLQNFIQRHNLKAGDEIVIERMSEYEYSVYPLRYSTEGINDETLTWIVQQVVSEEVHTTFVEGGKQLVASYRYERAPRARQVCIQHYGCHCVICGFDFEKTFGDIGKGFIHVHHLKPISEQDTEYTINPIEDLRPVCPNCHAMLHRRSPPYSINELLTSLQK